MAEFFMLTFIGIMVIISPGPDFAIVVKNSLAYGRQSGILSSIGVAIANLCHVTVNLLGIGIIISQSVIAFTIMKILGAIYLLVIGFKSLRSKPDKNDDLPEGSVVDPLERKIVREVGFFSGFLTSLLNPKACLFYLSFFSVMLSSTTPFLIQLSYGLWLSFLAGVWFLMVAIFFTNPKLVHSLRACKHWIERFTGGILMLFGMKLLTSKFS